MNREGDPETGVPFFVAADRRQGARACFSRSCRLRDKMKADRRMALCINRSCHLCGEEDAGRALTNRGGCRGDMELAGFCRQFGLVALPATVYGSVTLTNRIRIPEKSPSIAYMVLQRRMERRDEQAVQEGMAMPGPKA